MLGDYDEAEVHLTAAAAFSARFAARFTAARTALWWGRMHAERDGPGDRDAARIKLTEARDLAQAGSYAKVLARAERALDALPAQAEKPAPG